MTVLRRLDCVLEPTREAVLARASEFAGESPEVRDRMLRRTAGQAFYNTSKFDFKRLLADPAQIGSNLVHYILGFSPQAREIADEHRSALRGGGEPPEIGSDLAHYNLGCAPH